MLLLEGLFGCLFLDRVIGRVIGRIQVLSSFASAIVPSELATIPFRAQGSWNERLPPSDRDNFEME